MPPLVLDGRRVRKTGEMARDVWVSSVTVLGEKSRNKASERFP